MNLKSYKKFAVIGFLISTAASLYVLFGDHNLLEPRQALTMDFNQLADARTGAQILEQLSALQMRCEVQESALGQQMCVAPLTEYEGLPADNIVFFFDGQQRLTAVKLSLPAEQHRPLAELFARRYGTPSNTGAVDTWHVADGELALGPPEGSTTTTLWIPLTERTDTAGS